jgi:hypothetical protein
MLMILSMDCACAIKPEQRTRPLNTILFIYIILIITP